MPVLHLPVGEPVQLDLSSRDVVHSFWIVEFLYKKDVFPGRWNHEYFTPTKVGTFTGKCTELCGEYHSMMLFQVKVETRKEYDAYIQSLRDLGQNGQLSIDASRNQNLPGNGSTTGNEGK
jgi:cytochrome c oxidase subunit 2